MRLDEKNTKELLELHNSVADAPAGPKTFSTKQKLLARLRALAAAKGIDLENYAVRGGAQDEPGESQQSHASGSSTEVADVPKEPKKSGLGVGKLARVLLMNPIGYPHALIAAMLNAQLPGATATDKSVRWYAAKMRKEGIEVPARAKVFPAFMNEKQSAEYLATVAIVQEGAS